MKKYERPTLTIGEAAEVLGVHIDTVRNWEKRGYVNAVKTPGGHRRFDTKEIESIAGRSLSMPTRYEAEEKALVARWEKTNMLKQLDDRRKGPTAVLLENQRLFNEASSDNGDVAQFKRISVPLVRRIFGGTVLFDLISVQPMLGPTSLGYYFRKNQIVNEDLVATTFKMKAVWAYESQQDLRSVHNLDAEAELTAILAQELMMEVDRKVLTELCNEAGFKRTINFDYLSDDDDKYDQIGHQIIKTAEEAKELYNRSMPNWLVASPDIVKTLNFESSPFSEFAFGLGVSKRGTWKVDDETEIAVYSDPLFQPGKVLMGYRGEHEFDAGYIYAPYCPLQMTPVVLDPNSFTPRRGILSRFATKLTNPAYYSTLMITNFKSKDGEENKKCN